MEYRCVEQYRCVSWEAWPDRDKCCKNSGFCKVKSRVVALSPEIVGVPDLAFAPGITDADCFVGGVSGKRVKMVGVAIVSRRLFFWERRLRRGVCGLQAVRLAAADGWSGQGAGGGRGAEVGRRDWAPRLGRRGLAADCEKVGERSNRKQCENRRFEI